MTVAPGTSEESVAQVEAQSDLLDDVFGSAPASPTPGDETVTPHQRLVDPSDIPRLRSTHVTNGYREGIATSKEKYIQEGFDEGYSLGVVLGMRAGWCLGVLEGIVNAVAASNSALRDEAEWTDNAGEARPNKANMMSTREAIKALEEAEEELQVQDLFGKDYFDTNGIWLYDVAQEHTGPEEVTFVEVADAHPLVAKWTKAAREMAKEAGLNLT